jgi:hypothetical protein
VNAVDRIPLLRRGSISFFTRSERLDWAAWKVNRCALAAERPRELLRSHPENRAADARKLLESRRSK